MKNLLRYLASGAIAAAYAFGAADARAADCAAHVHLAAWHASGDFEAFTPGLGALCRGGDRGELVAGAGVYRNSLARTSWYGAAGYQPLELGDGAVRVGVLVGAVSGYFRPVEPLAGVLVSVGRVHAVVFPEVPGKTPWTVGFSLTLE